MKYITDALGGLFSLGGLIGFLVGVICTRIYYWAKEKYQDRCDPEGSPHHYGFRSLTMLWSLIFILTAFIGFAEQETANDVRHLSEQTSSCQTKLIDSLKKRSAISEDNDHWSYVQRKAIGDWIRDIIIVPPNIQHIRDTDPNWQNNPAYTNWAIEVTTRQSNIIQEAQREQDANIEERKQHPLPDPSCT